MPTDGQLVASSIEEMLVSLAAGIREAQEALNDLPPFDGFGRQAPTYFIPHLDFEFDVELITDSNSTGRPIMKIGKRTETTSSTTSSRITGRLVAIPPGEGLPVPSLSLMIEKQEGGKVSVVARASNSAGELLDDYQVELNVDEEASRAISTGRNVTTLPSVKLTPAVVTTDSNGEARSELTIKDGGSGKLIVLVAQLGTASAKLVINTAGAA